MSRIFDDIGGTINKIAKILFYICFITGIILLVVGLLTFLSSIDEYTSFSEALSCTLEDALNYKSLYGRAYSGKMQIKTGFCVSLSAFTMLPLYALGDIVYYLDAIKTNTAELVKNNKNNEE